MTRATRPASRAGARAKLRVLCPVMALLITAASHAAAPHGLIVALKDAPEHVEPVRDTTVLSARADGAAVQRERLQRVLGAAGLGNATASRQSPALRPQGRAAHVLQFDHALSPGEVDDMLARLRASPEVAWAEPNDREPLQGTTPSDPFFAGTGGQWWLQLAGGSDSNTIDARLRGVPGVQRAWTWTTGSISEPVAVLDTGITSHPELQGMWLPGVDMVSDPAMANDGDGRDSDPSDPGDWLGEADPAGDTFTGCHSHDSTWHGTIVSGILAARTDNNEGVAAVGWNARIVPVRVAGKCGAELADILDGMRWAAGLSVSDGRGGWLPRNGNPVRVINLSFGASKPCSRAYQDAIDELRAHGVLVVTAAGNTQGAVTRPGNCRGVVTVGALNRDGFKAHYSAFGPEVTLATVGGDDVGGPAANLVADGGVLTIFNSGHTTPGEAIYARSFGTSFATPIVAGTAALMLSLNSTLSVDQLIRGLAVSARPHVRSPWLAACSAANSASCLCDTDTCGAGILDAEQALLYARDPAAYVPPARQADVLDNAELAAASHVQPQASPP
ncbi:MAG TPA: S8 family peptidase, partial [Burkholderiaceae bacterium]|nr:S8 family peptidase [Burkholderiaceae bacterium]